MFDYKWISTLFYNNDKRKFVEFSVKSIIRKFNLEFEYQLNEDLYEYFLSQIDVGKFNNMRDLNKKIKKTFVDYVSTITHYIEVENDTPKVIFGRKLRKFVNDSF